MPETEESSRLGIGEFRRVLLQLGGLLGLLIVGGGILSRFTNSKRKEELKGLLGGAFSEIEIPEGIPEQAKLALIQNDRESILRILKALAQEYDVDYQSLASMARVVSGLQHRSWTDGFPVMQREDGSLGAMQVMASYGEGKEVYSEDIEQDLEANLRAGTQHLRTCWENNPDYWQRLVCYNQNEDHRIADELGQAVVKQIESRFWTGRDPVGMPVPVFPEEASTFQRMSVESALPGEGRKPLYASVLWQRSGYPPPFYTTIEGAVTGIHDTGTNDRERNGEKMILVENDIWKIGYIAGGDVLVQEGELVSWGRTLGILGDGLVNEKREAWMLNYFIWDKKTGEFINPIKSMKE